MPHRLPIVLACVAIAATSSAQDQWLYASTGNGLQVYDPETGEHVQSDYYPGLYGGIGILYDAGRLYTMSHVAVPQYPDYLIELHPATGVYSEVGPTGLEIPWAISSLVRDPTTGVNYIHDYSNGIYEIDLATGQVQFLLRLEEEVTLIRAVAIDSRGEAFGFGAGSIWYPHPAMYRIHLRTGDLEHIGDLAGPPFGFSTLSFDSRDRLWGAGTGPFSNIDYRLYRIDLETLELHSTFDLPEDFPSIHSITFGPKPDVTTYCESKPNSQGCGPAIDWKGHPSASANFGFEVSCSRVVLDSPGLLMLGFCGQADQPFQGGTLCVAEPIVRTTPQTSGGSAGCDGSWILDVNTWLFEQHPLDPGDSFTCQWWGRDPGLIGPDAGQLSDALEVVLLP